MVAQLAPPFDPILAAQLVDEFISAEKRFVQRDWEPAQLDGGQFCEIGARIVYHLDAGTLNTSKALDDCLRYVENDQVPHALLPRSDALHLCRVMRTVYKFRSQRGAVHISPTYSPNHMDSRFVIEAMRWLMNELLRIFWNGDRAAVARVIRELLQFDVPSIGVFDSGLLVQRTDLSPEEEILVLLHYAGDGGFSRNEVGRFARCAPSTVTRVLQKLLSPSTRQVVRLAGGNYRLTDLGSRRVRESLSDKLVM